MSAAKKVRLLIFLLTLFAHDTARADGTLTEIQPLSFGAIARPAGPATGNETVTVGTDGTVTSSGVMLLSNPGHYGVYDFEHYPTNREVAISIVDNTMVPLMAGTPFEVVDFKISCTSGPGPCMTDNDGKLEIMIGATLKMQNGGTYNGGPYRGTYDLTILIMPP